MEGCGGASTIMAQKHEQGTCAIQQSTTFNKNTAAFGTKFALLGMGRGLGMDIRHGDQLSTNFMMSLGGHDVEQFCFGRPGFSWGHLRLLVFTILSVFHGRAMLLHVSRWRGAPHKGDGVLQ